MRAGVRPEQMRAIDIVSIALAARTVVLGHIQHIEVILGSDYRTQVIESLHYGWFTVNFWPRLCLMRSLMIHRGWF